MNALARLCARAGLPFLVATLACGQHTDHTPGTDARTTTGGVGAASSTPPTAGQAPPSRDLDLLPLLAAGSIDANGPMIDFGEPQADAYLEPPLPMGTESVNGDSWAAVGPRVRLRVPVDTQAPPTFLRMHVRHAHARAVLAVIDGLPVRQASLVGAVNAAVITVPLPPDRFRRDIAEVELRFLGIPRSAPTRVPHVAGTSPLVPTLAQPMPAPRTQTPPARPPRVGARRRARGARRTRGPRVAVVAAPVPIVAEIDWVHFTRDDTEAVRTSDLVSDVRANDAPRRALTLYAPTAVSIVTVVPAMATFRATLSAEGIRGASRGPGVVHAHVRIEADGATPIESDTVVTAGSAWHDLSLDLGPLAGKATRITVSASDGANTRLAVAEPRIQSRPDTPPTPPPAVRHVVMLVIRGARYDRFAPTLSPRFSNGGFAHVMQQAVVARAVAPASRELAALTSVVTGLPADVHQLRDVTDTLDESAPTLAGILHEAGVATAGFNDDRWWEGSGLDRGFGERGGCTGEVALCRAETVLQRAGEWLVQQREQRAFVMVITRAGIPPFDPPPDLLAAIDPTPTEHATTPERTLTLSVSSRRGSLTLSEADRERIPALYDGALAGVDRGLGAMIERLRDAGMLEDTAILIVGDRGSALGENGYVGEGPGGTPLALATVAHTVLIARTPGGVATRLSDTASVLDAPITVLDRFGIDAGSLGAARRAGGASVFTEGGRGNAGARGIVLVANDRGDLGVRFGELIALGHVGNTLTLFQPDDDPLGQHDLALDRPMARALAERLLTDYRRRASDDTASRTFTPSTRALTPPVENAMRGGGPNHH